MLIQPLLDRLRCIFGFVGWCVGVLLEDLQFGQRDDITICRLVPDGLLRGAVVVVEAIGLWIEQLPPLRRVRTLDGNALKEMKRVNELTNNCDNARDPLSGVARVNLDLLLPISPAGIKLPHKAANVFFHLTHSSSFYFRL